MEYWGDGVLEYWSAGVLECWNVGVMEGWSTGVLEWWSDGVLEWWRVGVLEYCDWTNGCVRSQRPLDECKRTERISICNDRHILSDLGPRYSALLPL